MPSVSRHSHKVKEVDYIRVWYCENCGNYKLDFDSEKVFCNSCGYKMKRRKYMEVSQKV